MVQAEVSNAAAKPTVTVTPAPFTADDDFLRVQFTAPWVTTRGQHYYVKWWTLQPGEGCVQSFVSPPRLANKGQTVRFTTVVPSRKRLCAGPSRVTVVMGDGQTGRLVGKASLTVLG